MKRTAFFLLTSVLALALGAVVFELLTVAVLTLGDGRYERARDLLRSEEGTFIGDVTAVDAKCQYIDSLFPHPWLGFVHHANPPCGLPGINNIGLFGTDFPSERRPDRFVILLTGGSVAAQFGQMYANGPRFLEEALNDSYLSPTGRPFLVLNGGDGAWKQPQQTILFLLYSDVVDGVVTLDGYNEHYYASGNAPYRFEQPANNFAMANPLADDRYDVVATRWLVGRLVRYARRNPVWSRSHGAVMIIRVLRAAAERVPASAGDRKTTIQSIFALPPGWDQEKRAHWSMEQYKKYIRAMDVLAADRKVLAAHFIQPAPAIGKRLTPEEQAVVGDLGYAATYARMTEGLLSLRGDGTRIFSLLEMFKDNDETLYGDHAHMRSDAKGESRGYRLMGYEVARILAAEWGLKPKVRS